MVNLADLKKAKRGAIAKAISVMENDPSGARRLAKLIFESSGTSTIIGITGPAGVGKSSLISRLADELKKTSNPAILAVDPTSHITGGAILGDRARMSESDSDIFIRSIASRGSTGALSPSLRNIIRVLEYAGFDPIIIESVGAGQTEIDISKIADITIVLFNPNTGDSIQTIKAGLTEIGDIYVINKSDLAGADQLLCAVQDYIGAGKGGPAVLSTSAKKNRGISKLATHIQKLAAERKETKKTRLMQHLEDELHDIILNDIRQRVGEMLDLDKTYRRYLARVQSGKTDPYTAAAQVSKSLLK